MLKTHQIKINRNGHLHLFFQLIVLMLIILKIYYYFLASSTSLTIYWKISLKNSNRNASYLAQIPFKIQSVNNHRQSACVYKAVSVKRNCLNIKENNGKCPKMKSKKDEEEEEDNREVHSMV